MEKTTTPTKKSEIKRDWHLIDVKGEILGRISTEIVKLLMGKGKPYFVRNLDCGDYVVIVNAGKVKVTGRKEENKKYFRHSGYPGGFKARTFKEMRGLRPEEIIRHAVKGMLPQNKLRDRMLTRLYVFPDENHPYVNKLKVKS